MTAKRVVLNSRRVAAMYAALTDMLGREMPEGIRVGDVTGALEWVGERQRRMGLIDKEAPE